jgi:phage gp37-like protein
MIVMLARMTEPVAPLDTQVDKLFAALEARDLDGFGNGLAGIAGTVPGATPDEVQDALQRLEPALSLPFGIAGDLARLAGSMSRYATDPAVVVPTLVDRAAEVMESAARFATLHRQAFGEPPSPDAHDQVGPTLERFAGAPGLDRGEAELLVQAWFCADDWIQPVLYLCQRAEVRATLPQRARLTAAIEPVRDVYGTTHWLSGLLLVLDDEPLVVLDRGFAGTGRGYRATIGGIGDNFQLHTLLAGALIGGLLPGRAPTAVELAAAGTGEDLQPADGMHGNWNMVDAYGEWIWNEGRPADIPHLDGVRVVVLDPEPYPRAWNTGRQYPLMTPRLRIDGQLPPAEAADWLSRVKPPTR